MAQTRTAPGPKKGRSYSRKRRRDRATWAEIDQMPALLTTDDLARITGWSAVYCANQCRDGIFADVAVKTGRSYVVNKTRALEVLGLS